MNCTTGVTVVVHFNQIFRSNFTLICTVSSFYQFQKNISRPFQSIVEMINCPFFTTKNLLVIKKRKGNYYTHKKVPIVLPFSPYKYIIFYLSLFYIYQQLNQNTRLQACISSSYPTRPINSRFYPHFHSFGMLFISFSQKRTIKC